MCMFLSLDMISILWICIALIGAIGGNVQENYMVYEIEQGPLSNCNRLPEILNRLNAKDNQAYLEEIFWSQEDTTCLISVPLELEPEFSTVLEDMQTDHTDTKILPRPRKTRDLRRKTTGKEIKNDADITQSWDADVEAKFSLPMFPRVHYTIKDPYRFNEPCILSVSETKVQSGLPILDCVQEPTGDASEWFVEFGRHKGTKALPKFEPCDWVGYSLHLGEHCILYPVVFRSADPRYQMYYIGENQKLVIGYEESITFIYTPLYPLDSGEPSMHQWSTEVEPMRFVEFFEPNGHVQQGSNVILVTGFSDGTMDFKIDQLISQSNLKSEMLTIPKMVVTNSQSFDTEVSLSKNGIDFDVEQDEFAETLTNVQRLLDLDTLKKWFPVSTIDFSIIERKNTVTVPAKSKCEIRVGHVSHPRLNEVNMKFRLSASVKRSKFDADGNFVSSGLVPIHNVDPVFKRRFPGLVDVVEDESCTMLSGFLSNATNDLQALILPLTVVNCEPFVEFEHPLCDPIQ